MIYFHKAQNVDMIILTLIEYELTIFTYVIVCFATPPISHRNFRETKIAQHDIKKK